MLSVSWSLMKQCYIIIFKTQLWHLTDTMELALKWSINSIKDMFIMVYWSFYEILYLICRKNEDISCLYIIYQAAMFISSMLGPGTIFLMIVGALEVAVQGRISMWTSFVVNLIPVMVFIIMCYTTKCDTQVSPLVLFQF